MAGKDPHHRRAARRFAIFLIAFALFLVIVTAMAPLTANP